MPKLGITNRTRARRYRQRVSHDLDVILNVLRASPMAHVGSLVDGQPVVIPTMHWVSGASVFWHGSRASRSIRGAGKGEVCLTVTAFDGFVLARSAFHHSANYRSAMVFGQAEIVDGAEAKLAALRAFMEQHMPGRWDTLRAVAEQELKATTILSLPVTEATVKIRQGGPVDDPADLEAPVWAGVVPAHLALGTPLPERSGLGSEPPLIKM